jgi:hypothetical protein
MPAPKTPQSREEEYRAIQEAAARTVAGWPEWKRNATAVPIEERGRHRARSATPPPPDTESREEAYRRIQDDAARTVDGWPEWKRHATAVPVEERHRR